MTVSIQWGSQTLSTISLRFLKSYKTSAKDEPMLVKITDSRKFYIHICKYKGALSTESHTFLVIKYITKLHLFRNCNIHSAFSS